MPRDRRQLPHGYLKKIQDLAGRGMAQPLDILMRHPAEAEAIGDVVDGAQKPGKAVDERAVEIEDGASVNLQSTRLFLLSKSARYDIVRCRTAINCPANQACGIHCL